jgi:hypothetical protein
MSMLVHPRLSPVEIIVEERACNVGPVLVEVGILVVLVLVYVNTCAYSIMFMFMHMSICIAHVMSLVIIRIMQHPLAVCCRRRRGRLQGMGNLGSCVIVLVLVLVVRDMRVIWVMV